MEALAQSMDSVHSIILHVSFVYFSDDHHLFLRLLRQTEVGSLGPLLLVLGIGGLQLCLSCGDGLLRRTDITWLQRRTHAPNPPQKHEKLLDYPLCGSLSLPYFHRRLVINTRSELG